MWPRSRNENTTYLLLRLAYFTISGHYTNVLGGDMKVKAF